MSFKWTTEGFTFDGCDLPEVTALSYKDWLPRIGTVEQAFDRGDLKVWIAKKPEDPEIKINELWINKHTSLVARINIVTENEVVYTFLGDEHNRILSHQQDIAWFKENFTKVEECLNISPQE
jgi:hypothetical protein